jgi:hypothetical protein
MVHEAVYLTNVLETIFTDKQPLTVLVLLWEGRIVPGRNVVARIEDPFHVPDSGYFLVVVIMPMPVAASTASITTSSVLNILTGSLLIHFHIT